MLSVTCIFKDYLPLMYQLFFIDNKILYRNIRLVQDTINSVCLFLYTYTVLTVMLLGSAFITYKIYNDGLIAEGRENKTYYLARNYNLGSFTLN